MEGLDVLVVEDDTALRDVVVFHLRQQGWATREAGDGEVALAACQERLPDVVVLDVMLPGRSGLEVCAALRAAHHPSPGVVMLTALGAEADVVMGFDAGADDYVVKPFRPRELVARVRALGGRVRPGTRETPASIRHGELRIEPGARKVAVATRALKLTPTEYALLELLARAPSRVFSRLELLERVWDSSHEGYARNVDCHVTRLRRKLEAAGLAHVPIQTVHGVGYVFVAEAA